MSTRYFRILIYAPLAVAFGVMAIILRIAGTSATLYPSECALNSQVGAAVVLSVIGGVGFLLSLPPRQDERGWASWVAIGYDLLIGLGVFVGVISGAIILGGVSGTSVPACAHPSAHAPMPAPLYQLFAFLQAYTAVFFFVGAVVGWRGLRQLFRMGRA